ncbi:hypothetical protein RN001_013460 [Aquatica leii]|uniref:Transmembrane inner ear expressed protein n=1 Tax=Aquatica leii TaxID=1421715 RepID=A0AAN7PZW5_9COLE|nr:hypothetical protein RN001_013460 [Aquatica leii]
MASFEPNPNSNSEIWIEKSISNDLNFRIWHLIFFCFSGLVILVILICCCFKVRVPRTKQEIEADYQRKKITTKFREKLKLIQNQEMDAMDLKRALEIIQGDLSKETDEIEKKYLSANANAMQSMMAEPQQPQEHIPNRLAGIIKSNKFKQEASN